MHTKNQLPRCYDSGPDGLDGQTDQPTDRPTKRPIEAPSRSLKIWPIYMVTRKLVFGMQLAFNLPKRNIEKKIGIIFRSSSKSKF